MQSSPNKKLLWDWPVRACHWLMVALIVACWWTVENGHIVYHSYCAYALLGVVVFRIYWGFVGSSTARFTHFIQRPGAVWQYLKALPKREGKVYVGHNPLGGYSVILLLLLLLVQIALGLFAIDVDGFDGGPFSDYLSFETSRKIAEWHEISFNLLLGFIALHIGAVLYYLFWRRQNLTAAMIHGKADVANLSPGTMPFQAATISRFFIGIALASVVVWLIAW